MLESYEKFKRNIDNNSKILHYLNESKYKIAIRKETNDLLISEFVILYNDVLMIYSIAEKTNYITIRNYPNSRNIKDFNNISIRGSAFGSILLSSFDDFLNVEYMDEKMEILNKIFSRSREVFERIYLKCFNKDAIAQLTGKVNVDISFEIEINNEQIKDTTVRFVITHHQIREEILKNAVFSYEDGKFLLKNFV
mgnify:FL=1